MMLLLEQKGRVACLLLILAWLLPLGGEVGARPALEPQGGVKIGEIEETYLVIDYAEPASWTQVVHYPDAAYIKLHFARLTLKTGDVVRVSTPDGNEAYTYPGPDGSFDEADGSGLWALALSGDTAIVQLQPGAEAGASATETKQPEGVVIDKFARGYAGADLQRLIDDIDSQSVCGADDRQDAACYQGSHPTEFDKSNPVARLLAGGTLLCTGWRVGQSNRMLTNAHCLDSQSDVAATEAWFNYQRPACNSGSATTNRIIVRGHTFLTSDETLDYALFTLNNFSTVASFGFLEPDLRTPTLNEQIYIPQHGNGSAKQLAIASDVDSGNVCRINAPIKNGYGINTDSGYYCDTSGGSSGAPVLARSSHKVIALHHAGITSCAGMNVGVRMELIWPWVSPYFVDTPNGNIVINELDLGENDAVELYNAGTTTVNMFAWNLVTYNSSGSRDADYTFPAFSLAPGRYVTLREGSGSDSQTTLYMSSNINWVNGGSGAAVLYDDANNGLDFVRFGSSTVTPPGGTNWNGLNPASPGTGLLLGRDTASSDTDNGEDWCPQSGTLLAFNVGCESARVLINEIDVGDNDAIEIYNAEGETVNMNNWRLEVYVGNTNGGHGEKQIDYTFSGVSIAPGGYKILREGTGVDNATEIFLGNGIGGLGITWDYGTSGAVRLLDQDDKGVDFVRFLSSTLPPPAGTNWLGENPASPPPNRTLDRRGQGHDSDTGKDWCSWSASLGGQDSVCPLYLPMILR